MMIWVQDIFVKVTSGGSFQVCLSPLGDQVYCLLIVTFFQNWFLRNRSYEDSYTLLGGRSFLEKDQYGQTVGGFSISYLSVLRQLLC